MSKKDPFKYFHRSPEIIRLSVMLHERGINISHETVRFWWLRFGLMFAAEIKKAPHRGHAVEPLALVP